ncbi:HNH endonuclease [Salmonella phage SeKF_13]
MEIWKTVSRNKNYQVSNYGSVRSVDRHTARSDTGKLVFQKGKVLKPCKDKYGYVNVYIPSRVRIHILVAEAFLPLIDGLNQINHIDGDKSNNHVDNLERTNNSGNQIHAIEEGLRPIPLGRLAGRFEYTTFAISLDSNEILAIMNGSDEMVSAGFNPKLVSAVALGKRSNHKGCTFVRIKQETKHE